MSIKEFVDNQLCIPVTRIGNQYIVESIEIVLDTKEHKFYQKLSSITNKSPRYLEKAMRDSKLLGLAYMDTQLRETIFGKGGDVATTEYILKASEYYRRTYGTC